MYNSFTNKPSLTPYKHRPARVDLAEKNPDDAPGARRSAQLDFTKEDAAPDIEFNEIIWKSVRGADSQMPAPVRSAFVRAVADDDDDDEEEEREEERRARRRAKRKR
jgi:hypothetical protein